MDMELTEEKSSDTDSVMGLFRQKFNCDLSVEEMDEEERILSETVKFSRNNFNLNNKFEETCMNLSAEDEDDKEDPNYKSDILQTSKDIGTEFNFHLNLSDILNEISDFKKRMPTSSQIGGIVLKNVKTLLNSDSHHNDEVITSEENNIIPPSKRSRTEAEPEQNPEHAGPSRRLRERKCAQKGQQSQNILPIKESPQVSVQSISHNPTTRALRNKSTPTQSTSPSKSSKVTESNKTTESKETSSQPSSPSSSSSSTSKVNADSTNLSSSTNTNTAKSPTKPTSSTKSNKDNDPSHTSSTSSSNSNPTIRTANILHAEFKMPTPPPPSRHLQKPQHSQNIERICGIINKSAAIKAADGLATPPRYFYKPLESSTKSSSTSSNVTISSSDHLQSTPSPSRNLPQPPPKSTPSSSPPKLLPQPLPQKPSASPEEDDDDIVILPTPQITQSRPKPSTPPKLQVVPKPRQSSSSMTSKAPPPPPIAIVAPSKPELNRDNCYFQCQYCPKRYYLYNDNAFKQHLIIAHDYELEEFEYDRFIKKKLDGDFSKKQLKHECGICGMVKFSARYELRKHLESVHDRFLPKVILTPGFRCSQCLKRFDSSLELTRHVLNCSNRNPDNETLNELAKRYLNCEVCVGKHERAVDVPECFFSKNILRCLLCFDIFKKKANFYKHLLTYHGLQVITSPKFTMTCPFCPKTNEVRWKYEEIFPHILIEHFKPRIDSMGMGAGIGGGGSGGGGHPYPSGSKSVYGINQPSLNKMQMKRKETEMPIAIVTAVVGNYNQSSTSTLQKKPRM